MKGAFEGSLYVSLEGAPKIFFQGALEIAEKGKEKKERSQNCSTA